MNNQRGFTLVVSVLVLSTILLLIGTTAAYGIARYQQRDLGYETGLDAKLLAEGCAETALQKLNLNNAYAGNETISIQGATCTIRPVTGTVTKTIETEGVANGYYYRLRVTVATLSPFEVSSWTRVDGF